MNSQIWMEIVVVQVRAGYQAYYLNMITQGTYAHTQPYAGELEWAQLGVHGCDA